jgi:hypothetical protein
MSQEIRTDSLRPMTNIQIQQTRDFVKSLDEVCQTYWDMVNVGDVLSRELHMTPELVILYADAVEDYNPWYEGWRMNTWYIPGESPFWNRNRAAIDGVAFCVVCSIRPYQTICHWVHPHYHDTEIFEPIPVGAKVRISAKAIDKFIKRERRYVRHEVTVEDVTSGLLYMRETRDILSL